jgi:hypothetical protein
MRGRPASLNQLLDVAAPISERLLCEIEIQETYFCDVINMSTKRLCASLTLSKFSLSRQLKCLFRVHVSDFIRDCLFY